MTPQFASGMTALKKMYFPQNSVKSGSLNGSYNANFVPNCTSIEKIVLPYTYEYVHMYAFNCSYNATLIIGDAVHGSNIISMNNYHSFQGVKFLILYATTPPRWHNNDSSHAQANARGNDTLPSGCKIYVPDSAVDTYKNSNSTTLWGSWASRIYPISEFEGEL